METTLFAQFRPIIAAASEAEILRDPKLGGRLTLDGEGRIEIAYAPFEHVVPTARVVIIGITPGAQQAGNATAEARRRILSGDDDATALEAAKVYGSFSGAMRDSLVRMLDHVGLNARLGIPTCARLWDSHAHLAHFTSALRYPVFLDGENYNGNPSMTRTPILRSMIEHDLAEEARMLPDALWIPCGGTAAEGVDWLVRKGVLDPDRVCLGMPHPSPANAERVQYFLGIGRERSALSPKTNPDLIERARAEMIDKIHLLDPCRPTTHGDRNREPGLTSHASGSAPEQRRAEVPRLEKRTKSEGKTPSPLGVAIQAAMEANGRYVVHQPPRLYHHTLRTREKGTVFAVERCTKNAIVVWVPASAELADAIMRKGILVPEVSRPYPNGPDKYGRLSTLEQVPELAQSRLFPVKVTTPREALDLLALLP